MNEWFGYKFRVFFSSFFSFFVFPSFFFFFVVVWFHLALRFLVREWVGQPPTPHPAQLDLATFSFLFFHSPLVLLSNYYEHNVLCIQLFESVTSIRLCLVWPVYRAKHTESNFRPNQTSVTVILRHFFRVQ